MKPYTPPSFQGKFGIARRDITPPTGIYARNWGLAKHDTAESIHQPLTLTALVMTDLDENDLLAIVALDLGWWRSREEEMILAQAVTDAGFSPEKTILALSHTHSGPSFCPHDSNQQGGDKILPFLENLAQKITEALQEARTHLTAGILETTSGTCPLATSRELHVNGRPVVGWNPALPVDQTLLLGRISDFSGRCIATLVNYACHPTILAWQNKTISPDFIGSMREVVEKETKAPCLFLQGASGDLAARQQYTGDLQIAEHAGLVLAHSVLSLWYQMLPPGNELGFEGIVESGAPLGLWNIRPRTDSLPSEWSIHPSHVSLPVSSDLPSRDEIIRAQRATTDRTLTERYHRLKLRREAIGDRQETDRPCLTAKLGGIALVSIADEVYSAMQVHLRNYCKTTPLFIITLANRNLGYLVPAPLHSPEHYASRVTPYAPGSFEIMQRHLEQQLHTVL